MLGYARNPVHRRNRRKLGKNQLPAVPGVAVAITSSGTTNATLTFNRPVTVTGNIGLTVDGLTLVSQTIVSPTVVTQVWSGNVATKDFSVDGNDPNVGTYAGGRLIGASGTFP